MVAAMLSYVDTLIATSPENPRTLAAGRLAEVAVACGHNYVRVVEDPRAALQAAKLAAAPDAVVIATGSVHLVGDLLSEPGQRTVTAL
jgi:folylpolyglutamate synthase/dihydropteroate synthase